MNRSFESDPLAEMNPTTRFTDRAADYAQHRPSYPAAAFDAMLRGLADPSQVTAADIGAGTGISSRLLADRGVHVLAIEPNAAMRAAAEVHPRVEWSEGVGEATGLPDASVDLVLVAQAFHWFRQRDALREFHRVLRPNGRLALIWNNRDRKDPLTSDYVGAIHTVNGEDPIERRHFDRAVVDQDGHFTKAKRHTFAHQQEVDAEGLVGRATSASYVPREGPRFDELRRLLLDLFERHRDARGRVVLRYVTKLYLATRR
jgi:SAM-dependent methyltransferase